MRFSENLRQRLGLEQFLLLAEIDFEFGLQDSSSSACLLPIPRDRHHRRALSRSCALTEIDTEQSCTEERLRIFRVVSPGRHDFDSPFSVVSSLTLGF
jgi:hypothetical protein